MAFVVHYYSRERVIWESNWSLDIPPSCRQVRAELAVLHAERAVISDDNGFELVIEERQKYDA